MQATYTARYEALMDVIRSRMTVRAFDPARAVPREHYEMILEAARHSPSGANAQPWHFIVVTEQDLKQKTAYEISECDWSSDVCSSDLLRPHSRRPRPP